MVQLSDNATRLMRYFRDQNCRQAEYVLPADMLGAFAGDAEACEQAQDELSGLGLIDVVAGMPRHIPVSNRIVAAAITLEGERFLAKNSVG